MEDSTTPPEGGARPQSGAPGPRPEAGHQFFDWIRSTGLTRPDTGWVGGVMALLAQKLRWDATLVRGLGVVALVLFFSPVILLYGLAWILVPDSQGRIPAQQALRGDFTGGLVGGAALAVLGALNVFTPLSLAGPFAILVNLLVIGVVVWIVVAMVRGHQRSGGPAGGAYAADGAEDADAFAREVRREQDREARRDARRAARDARHEARRAAREAAEQAKDEAPGKARAGSSSSVRDDVRPAWYPKETVSGAAHGSGQDSGSGAGPAPSGAHAQAYPSPGPSAAEREEARRRRMVSFGLLLAAASGVLLAVWVLGIPGTSALLLGLVGLVIVLALTHMVAGLRGRRGRGFLLTAATLAMLATFFVHQNPGSAPSITGSNVAFGQHTSQEDSVNSAFANTTMDLRHLADRVEPGVTEIVHAELNAAFSNTTVIIPDDAALTVQSRQALGGLEIHTQDEERSIRGMDVTEHRIGDQEADLQIMLSANTAFNRVEIYDAATYAQQVEGVSDEETDAPSEEEPAALVETHRVPGSVAHDAIGAAPGDAALDDAAMEGAAR